MKAWNWHQTFNSRGPIMNVRINDKFSTFELFYINDTTIMRTYGTHKRKTNDNTQPTADNNELLCAKTIFVWLKRRSPYFIPIRNQIRIDV